MNFECKLEGIDAAALGIKGLNRVIDAVEQELYQFCEEVMADSKLIVPVDTGALMSSGKVLPPVRDDGEIRVEMGYGDETADYAVYVHEAIDRAINWTRPGSGPKFLERPLNAKVPELPSRISLAVARAIA